MGLNEAQAEVMELAKAKGFPLGKADAYFLSTRVKDEADELHHEVLQELQNESKMREEAIDIVIQGLQFLGSRGADADQEFRKKMDKNWKRDWNKV